MSDHEHATAAEVSLSEADCQMYGYEATGVWVFPTSSVERLTAARLAPVQAERDDARKVHRDLTRRLGFGDDITEPQADNDTIVRWFEEQSSEAAEWRESQRWREECYWQECPDGEDCYEHDPALRLERTEAERDRLAAGIAALADECERLAGGNEAVRGKPTRVAGYYRRFAAKARALLAEGDTAAGGDASGCECVPYAIRTDYGTGIEHDLDRSSCPEHANPPAGDDSGQP